MKPADGANFTVWEGYRTHCKCCNVCQNDRICDIIFQLYPSAWCQIIHLTKTRTESENSRLVPFSATKKLPWGKWLPRPQKWMEKKSDKSHGSTGMFPHRFGLFLPLVGHLPSEKSILLDFSSSRVVAISVPFPEVRIRKGTESGLPSPLHLKKRLINLK